MKTMLFNPYTGLPRHPSDIASDPAGTLMLDPDEPVIAAKPAQTAEAEWDGKLPDSLERSLNALSLEVPPDVASDHAYAVRQAFKAICTDRATLRHLYKAMQAKVPVAEGGTA